MSGRKSKQLRKELIEKLGRAPTPSEWRRFKKHGLAIADRELPKLSPVRAAEIKEKVMEAVRTRQPMKARRTLWQRFIDWLLRRDKRSGKQNEQTNGRQNP